MNTPTSDFIQAATPTKQDVAAAMGDDYQYFRKVAAGRPPGAALRDRVARWGWRHVRELVDRLWLLSPEIAAEQAETALAALRSTLPDAAPPPAVAVEPLPVQPVVTEPEQVETVPEAERCRYRECSKRASTVKGVNKGYCSSGHEYMAKLDRQKARAEAAAARQPVTKEFSARKSAGKGGGKRSTQGEP